METQPATPLAGNPSRPATYKLVMRSVTPQGSDHGVDLHSVGQRLLLGEELAECAGIRLTREITPERR
jgi:hypothetical protein